MISPQGVPSGFRVSKHVRCPGRFSLVSFRLATCFEGFETPVAAERIPGLAAPRIVVPFASLSLRAKAFPPGLPRTERRHSCCRSFPKVQGSVLQDPKADLSPISPSPPVQKDTRTLPRSERLPGVPPEYVILFDLVFAFRPPHLPEVKPSFSKINFPNSNPSFPSFFPVLSPPKSTLSPSLAHLRPPSEVTS